MNPKSQLQQEYIQLKLNKSVSPQNRGYEFERLLFRLFEMEQLEAVKSYRTKEEQTDGMFEYRHHHYLMEARWIKSPVPASQLLALAAKVSGKFMDTRGVFLSMSGFSKDAPNALRYFPFTNILLFNQEDLDYSFSLEYSFSEILKVKLNYASRIGGTYYSFQEHLRQQKK